MKARTESRRSVTRGGPLARYGEWTGWRNRRTLPCSPPPPQPPGLPGVQPRRAVGRNGRSGGGGRRGPNHQLFLRGVANPVRLAHRSALGFDEGFFHGPDQRTVLFQGAGQDRGGQVRIVWRVQPQGRLWRQGRIGVGQAHRTQAEHAGQGRDLDGRIGEVRPGEGSGYRGKPGRRVRTGSRAGPPPSWRPAGWEWNPVRGSARATGCR